MYKLPQSIIFAIIAFNLTAFTIPLQMDLFVIKWFWLKVVMWLLTIAAWVLTYRRRNRYFILF